VEPFERACFLRRFAHNPRVRRPIQLADTFTQVEGMPDVAVLSPASSIWSMVIFPTGNGIQKASSLSLLPDQPPWKHIPVRLTQ